MTPEEQAQAKRTERLFRALLRELAKERELDKLRRRARLLAVLERVLTRWRDRLRAWWERGRRGVRGQEPWPQHLRTCGTQHRGCDPDCPTRKDPRWQYDPRDETSEGGDDGDRPENRPN